MQYSVYPFFFPSVVSIVIDDGNWSNNEAAVGTRDVQMAPPVDQ